MVSGQPVLAESFPTEPLQVESPPLLSSAKLRLSALYDSIGKPWRDLTPRSETARSQVQRFERSASDMNT
jgi:hypothetical protein